MVNPQKSILIADCHEDVLISLEKLLEEAGFATTSVWSARDAHRVLASRSFHLLLLNEYLPDAECEQLLHSFCRKGLRVPCVVMVSSAPEVTDITPLRDLGVREVVCKRSHQQVLDAITRSLSGSSVSAA